MAKRMMVDFQRRGFPQYVSEEEEGAAKPCAVGIEWVNPDSLRTIAKRHVARTDPWGRRVEGERPRGGARGTTAET
jgi:hypothetical protein